MELASGWFRGFLSMLVTIIQVIFLYFTNFVNFINFYIIYQAILYNDKTSGMITALPSGKSREWNAIVRINGNGQSHEPNHYLKCGFY